MSFVCPGITRWKSCITNVDELREKYNTTARQPYWAYYTYSSIVPSDECLHVIVELANLYKKYTGYIKIRCEHHWGNIYCNNPAIINKFLEKTKTHFLSREWSLYLDKVVIPAKNVDYNNKNIVYKKKLPYDKYRYKVILSVSKRADYYTRGMAWLNWASNVEDILVPFNAADSLMNQSYAYGVIYFYCTDEATLQMSQFLLGDSIKTIQQFELFDK